MSWIWRLLTGASLPRVPGPQRGAVRCVRRPHCRDVTSVTTVGCMTPLPHLLARATALVVLVGRRAGRQPGRHRLRRHGRPPVPPRPHRTGLVRRTTTPSSVKGAELQVSACLDDLTTAGTVASGHTDQADWNGLHAAGTRNPSGVPGIQVDGYFPDTSTTNTNHGLEPRRPVRHPAPRGVERRDRRHRRARRARPVRERLHHRRLGAEQGLRLRLDRQGQHRGGVLPRRLDARRLDPRVAPAGHPAHPRHEAGGPPGVRRAARPHLHGRHLQRRLPHALAAGEQPAALRRRARLGGHPLPRRGPEPADLPADGAQELPGVRRDRATRRPTTRSSAPASRPGRSSCGRSTTPTTGT